MPHSTRHATLVKSSRRPVWVVKLGRSLLGQPALEAWLEVLAAPAATATAPALVVVPGAGPFLEPVRSAQTHFGLSDSAAHRMLVLAMEQCAAALCDLDRRLKPAAKMDELARLRQEGATALWQPARMVKGWTDITPGWATASDSLAAWLAADLRAERLILVKTLPGHYPENSTADLRPLVSEGLLDSGFPEQVRRFAGEIWCVRNDAYGVVAAARKGATLTGLHVLAHPLALHSDHGDS